MLGRGLGGAAAPAGPRRAPTAEDAREPRRAADDAPSPRRGRDRLADAAAWGARSSPRRDDGGVLEGRSLTCPATRFQEPISPYRRVVVRVDPAVRGQGDQERVRLHRQRRRDGDVRRCDAVVPARPRRAPGQPLVTMVPVSVRTPEQFGTFGNRVSTMIVELPTDEADAPGATAARARDDALGEGAPPGAARLAAPGRQRDHPAGAARARVARDGAPGGDARPRGADQHRDLERPRLARAAVPRGRAGSRRSIRSRRSSTASASTSRCSATATSSTSGSSSTARWSTTHGSSSSGCGPPTRRLDGAHSRAAVREPQRLSAREGAPARGARLTGAPAGDLDRRCAARLASARREGAPGGGPTVRPRSTEGPRPRQGTTT